MKIVKQRVEPSPGVLYLVGTPIGHLGDLSPRAKMILSNVEIIACEDTRHSGLMLKRLEINSPLLSFHKHNSKKRAPQILEMLRDDKSVALISDAGLPAICDPGELLVKIAIENGHEVICIPGPCAATTALVTSGLPSNRFCFEGFLPQKGKLRKERLNEIAKEKRTTIIYEAPHRLIKLLDELLSICDKHRPIQVSRELTKKHEENIKTNIEGALNHFKLNKPLGEFTIILGGSDEKTCIEYDKDFLYKKMTGLIKEGESVNDAAKKISKETGFTKRELYSLIHNKKDYLS